MLAALETLPRRGRRVRAPAALARSLPVAEELAAALREHPAADRVEVAGLGAPLGRDLQGHRPDRDRRRPGRARPSTSPSTRWSPQAGTAGDERDAARRPTTASRSTCGSSPPETFGNLLQHFTGSPAHNVQLREARSARGLSVSEHGITETSRGQERCTASPTRSGVYERLGSPTSSRSCARAAASSRRRETGELPELVTVGDIRGDLHSHTTLSDGRNTLEEMADGGARARLRLPRDHRPLGQPRLRRPRHRRGAGEADRGGREPGTRAPTGLPPARRLRGQHRPRRRARLPRRAARRARLGRRQRPHLVLRSPSRR